MHYIVIQDCFNLCDNKYPKARTVQEGMGEERGAMISSSESVLKVTYGNVGGQKNFSPAAGFRPTYLFITRFFFPFRLEILDSSNYVSLGFQSYLYRL